MNNYRNTKSLSRRNIEGLYITDDVEKINEANINEETDYFDDDLFKSINRMINNKSKKAASSNYAKAAEYLSRLVKTKIVETTDGRMIRRKLSKEERLEIVANMFPSNMKKEASEAEEHFLLLAETLYSLTEQKRYALISQQIEYPLECMSSYIQCTTNSEAFLRRKYYDGQKRKKKDGGTYQRKHNIQSESDLTSEDENGHKISPIEEEEHNDKYFDTVDELMAVLNDRERKVAISLAKLSTYDKRATIQELIDDTGYTKRQVETIETNLKFKMLKWLQDNEFYDDYRDYFSVCNDKYKDFYENYIKFLKKCEKQKSMCTI